jgi:hypothetical protein
MMIRVLSSLCLLAVVVAGSAAHAQKKPTIAILGLEVGGGGVDQEATKVAQELTVALRVPPKTGKVKYALASNSDTHLTDQKLMNDCQTEEKSCMAAIGKGLGAEYLMWGRVERKSQGRQAGYQVSLKLLDISNPTGNTPSRTDFIPLDEATTVKLGDWGRRLYKQMTNEAAGSKLVLTISNAERATILIDGTERGNITSGHGEVDLEPGRYKIAVVAPGFARWESPDQITIRPGEDVMTEVTLAPLKGTSLCDPTVSICENTVGTTSGGRGKWIAVMAAGLAITAGGGTFAYISYKDYKDIEDRCANPADCGYPSEGARDDDGKKKARNASIGWGIAGFGAAVAIVGVVKGFVVAETENRAVGGTAGVRARKRSGFAFTPVIGPESAGATLRIDW